MEERQSDNPNKQDTTQSAQAPKPDGARQTNPEANGDNQPERSTGERGSRNNRNNRNRNRRDRDRQPGGQGHAGQIPDNGNQRKPSDQEGTDATEPAAVNGSEGESSGNEQPGSGDVQINRNQPRNDRNRRDRDRQSGSRSPENRNQSEPADQQRSGNDELTIDSGTGEEATGNDQSTSREDQTNRNQPRNDRNRRDRDRPDRQAGARPGRNEGNRSRDRLFDMGDGSPRDEQPAVDIDRTDRPVIGISLGDYNGIGPEVILKALKNNQLNRICTPVVYGSLRILNRYRNLLDLKDWSLNGIQDAGQINPKLTNVITCWPDQDEDILPGQVTPEAGRAAFASLQRAVDDLKAGAIDALVTAPINKSNIQSETFKFPGHTEYLAEQFGVSDNLMFLVSDLLRVGVVTGHVPLGRVRQHISRERIAQKLTLMMQSLKQDYGIDKPKIAVLGLNPHAGEEGLLGNEEQDIIKPLLADWQKKGHLVFGPYPADGFFGTRSYLKFDAVLAMYHDQGLIPFKAIAFEEGVNFTAGMPVVRTSPDHGTAYDIAGKNLADETSMLQAIYTAIDVARTRKESLDLAANALK